MIRGLSKMRPRMFLDYLSGLDSLGAGTGELRI